MKRFIREIMPSVKLYQDPANGIAWIEDGRVGIGISVHPNIDVNGSVQGMIARQYWQKEDRIVESHGWLYNIDRFSYDKEDELEALVAQECMCQACQERRNSPMLKPTQKVAVTWMMCGFVDVPEAKSTEEAMAIVKARPDDFPLPQNGIYVDGSFGLSTDDVTEMAALAGNG